MAALRGGGQAGRPHVGERLNAGESEVELNEARELIASPIWAKVRDKFLATGEFVVYPRGDVRRLEYLPDSTRRQIAIWVEGLGKAAEWRTVVNGDDVRALKAKYPGVYPDALRFSAYFTKFGAPDAANRDFMMLLLKLKFPEAYELCCS